MTASVPAHRADVQTLYQDHQPWLLAWLRKKLGCPHGAADLSHDTFLRLIEQPAVPVLREPRAWLLVVANRLLINRHQRQRVEAETLRAVALMLESQAEPDPEQVVAARELLASVLRWLMNELPARQRQALLMARVDGLAIAEIAHRLGVSDRSVKLYLAQGLAYCHARLHEVAA